MSATNNDIIRLMDSQLKTLRLENARLESLVRQLRSTLDTISVETHFGCSKEAQDLLKQSPSTALAEFLGPTIEALTRVHQGLLEGNFYDDYDAATKTIGDLRRDISRLTTAIGGDK